MLCNPGGGRGSTLQGGPILMLHWYMYVTLFTTIGIKLDTCNMHVHVQYDTSMIWILLLYE